MATASITLTDDGQGFKMLAKFDGQFNNASAAHHGIAALIEALEDLGKPAGKATMFNMPQAGALTLSTIGLTEAAENEAVPQAD